MALEIFEMEQGSPEWYATRSGVITASCFSKVYQGKGQGKMREKYLRQIAGERVSGLPMENYSNEYMQRGKKLEAKALELYSETAGVTLRKIGFMKDGNYGASADALIGEDGGAEIKTRTSDLQIDLLLSGEVPNEHLPQIQGNMFVSGRKWWDFVCYSPNMPLFIKRVPRNEMFIVELKRELAAFDKEVIELTAKINKLF